MKTMQRNDVMGTIGPFLHENLKCQIQTVFLSINYNVLIFLCICGIFQIEFFNIKTNILHVPYLHSCTQKVRLQTKRKFFLKHWWYVCVFSSPITDFNILFRLSPHRYFSQIYMFVCATLYNVCLNDSLRNIYNYRFNFDINLFNANTFKDFTLDYYSVITLKYS